MTPGSIAGGPAHSSFSFLKAANGEPLQDEYDPAKPNDYEDIMKERERRQRAAEEEAEKAARQRELDLVRCVLLCCGMIRGCSLSKQHHHEQGCAVAAPTGVLLVNCMLDVGRCMHACCLLWEGIHSQDSVQITCVAQRVCVMYRVWETYAVCSLTTHAGPPAVNGTFPASPCVYDDDRYNATPRGSLYICYYFCPLPPPSSPPLCCHCTTTTTAAIDTTTAAAAATMAATCITATSVAGARAAQA